MIKREMIYDANQTDFFQDVRLNKFADKLQENFTKLSGYRAGESEYRSWTTTGDKIKNLMEEAQLEDIHVSFEYQVPYCSERIDCMIFGKNESNHGVVIHIELKQWKKVEPLADEGNFVETVTGGSIRKVPHPSQQVSGYNDHLLGFVEVFEEKELDLYGCSYCPNYIKTDQDGLFSEQYKPILEKYPIYTHDEIRVLALRLKKMLINGNGFEIFNKFMQSPIRPSKKLLENVSKIINNTKQFSLLNDQIYAKNAIMHKIKSSQINSSKNIVLVKGGPGTGKTVIALHILAELASKKKENKEIFFSTKSKPLLEALRDKIGKEAQLLFTSLSPFVPSKIEENKIDVLIIDEAHRIGKTSNNQFTKAVDRTDMPQIEQLIRCAKTAIFFIDDHQVIRNLEIGCTDLIKKTAEKYKIEPEEIELVSQFRCNGSDNYLAWLESILGHSKKELNLSKKDNFQFEIVDSPEKLYRIISEKNSEQGQTARLVAGYCWPWSQKLDENHELIKDVRIGTFAMPWETHEKVKPPKGYVKWYEWAYKPEGIKQVGCIYTAQGFEFDYIGVIVGPDLSYDASKDCLIGNIDGTKDPTLKRGKTEFDKYVKNIYRVLLSRGMKGCYVYFVDKAVENFFKSRILTN